MSQPIDTAPKDRRILGYGISAFQSAPGWVTVKWHSLYERWELNPTEATEYDPEPCTLTHWLELPGDPTK